MKTLIFILLTAGLAFPVSGQSADSLNQQLTEAYIQDNVSDWPPIINRMQTLMDTQPSDSLLLHLTIHQYGYAGYLMDQDEEGKARTWIEKADKNCDRLIERSFCADGYALKAGLTGYRITMSPLKAPFLGRKNQNYISKAIECDSLNPLIWSQKGNAYYHMPRMFGGSYEKASRYFKKSVELFEQQAENTYPQWLYLNELMWYAKALVSDDKPRLARAVYQKALEKAPNFKRIKTELEPKLKADH